METRDMSDFSISDQDSIFLIREIRDNCPDTIPFLTSADLLYLTPTLTASLWAR